MTSRCAARRVLLACDVTAAGGVSVYLGQLVDAAQTSGYEATVLLDAAPSTDCVERFLVGHSCRILRAPLLPRRTSEDAVAGVFQATLESLRPHLVHAVLGSLRSLLVPREVCLSQGVPLITTEQYVAADLEVSPQILDRIRRLHAGTAIVIWVSSENQCLARECFACTPTRAIVIPNSIRTDVNRSRRERKSRKILSVARLTRQKGIDTLLHAITLMKISNAELSIAGDGEQAETLMRLTEELGLSPRVRFLGWRHDVPELLQKNDIFVLSSRAEGTPFALIEALAARMPCIVTRVSGMPEVLDSGRYGYLVPPEQPAALAAALDQFFEYPDDLWGKADLATAHLQRHYNQDENMARTMDLWACVSRGMQSF